MADSHDFGRWGEDLAARHLAAHGWTILQRNWRLGHKEIDLVASRRGIVAFVEVKSRSGAGFGHPLDAITPTKRREIERVARAWVARLGHLGATYRFDAIAVVRDGTGPPRIEHLKDAWRI